MDNLFFHYMVGRELWKELLGDTRDSEGGRLGRLDSRRLGRLHIGYRWLGGGKRGKCLWRSVVSVIWWMSWKERNAMTFQDKYMDEVGSYDTNMVD